MILIIEPRADALAQAREEAKQFGHRTGVNDDLVRGQWIDRRAAEIEVEMNRWGDWYDETAVVEPEAWEALDTAADAMRNFSPCIPNS